MDSQEEYLSATLRNVAKTICKGGGEAFTGPMTNIFLGMQWDSIACMKLELQVGLIICLYQDLKYFFSLDDLGGVTDQSDA